MAENDKINRINQLIMEKNFLSAYLIIKESTLSRDTQIECLGKIAQALLEEPGFSPGRRNTEKTVFYRSLLLMICEDVPGFARIYKRQLRAVQEPDSPFNLIRQIKNFTDPNDKSEMQEKIEDTIEDISEKIEDTAENIKDGKIEESVNDIFTFAGKGILDGLKNFNSFLKQVTGADSGQNTKKDEDDPQLRNDEPPMRKAEPIEKEKAVEEDQEKPGAEDDD